MLLPLGSFLNPESDSVNFRGRQFGVSCGGRGHAECLVIRRDASKHFALIRIPGHNGESPFAKVPLCTFFSIESQLGNPIRLVWTVTGKTFVRQNRTNVPIELDPIRR
jgi:hypothetical protein